jgi:ABC-type bacteriocin/lantibiotic exporter with double-glycine peptidase domain
MTENPNITAASRFISLLKPDRQEIRNIYIFAIFSGLMSMALPLGIQAIINFIQMGQVSTSWFILVGLVVVAIGFAGFMNIAQLRITENLQQRIFSRAAFEFADRIPKIKLMEFVKNYAPELTNRFFDTLTIQKGLAKLLIDFTAATLQIIFGLVLLSFYHSFFIFFGLFLVLLLLFIFWLTAQKGFKSSLEESKYKYKIAHWLEEIAHSRISFKLAGRNLLPLNKVESYLDNYLKARNTHFRVLVTQYALLIGFKVLIALSLLIVGGILVLNQQMNIGQFVAAEIIIVLVLNSVEKMILSLEVVYDVLTAVEKIGQVTDLEIEHYEGRYLSECSEKGLDVVVKEVTYETEIYRSPILEDVSFVVEPGQKVSFITDSSVSTNVLFCLIGGLYEPNKGGIVVNGIPLGNINLQKLRYDIGNMLTQDKLFNGSIAQNISLGREKVGFEEVVRVSKLLHLNQYLDMFSDGYDTIVNPESYFVPKDVVRKILLARSIAGSPKLLLLENPTDSLNQEQIDTVINAITQQINSTILLDSLDDRIHQISDRIIKIEQGRIIFDGSYDNYKRHFN